MKRLSIALVLSVSLLFTSGCIDKYLEDIEELEQRLDKIEQLCNEMNTNVRSLQVIVSSIQDKDMISGVTSITQNGKEVGYKINFVKTGPITIYHGTNGKVPLIGTAKDTDGNYYWNIQYDNGKVGWITDEYGQKVLAMGIAPFVKVKNERWIISYDGGTTWTDLGQATGEHGDSMFKNIVIAGNYVSITLAGGTEFKIPLYDRYLELRTEAARINSNTIAQEILIRSIASKVVYINKVEEIIEKVGVILKSLDTEIIVQGHADDRPINTPVFPSNWELSTKRATNVVKFLIDKCGLEEKNLTAAGNAEFKPIAPNDSEYNMQKNRRIDIVIFK